MIASSNEYRILSLMWREGKPISRADILRGTVGRNWNPASIHLILNSMISKGFIKITDESKNYGRTYEPLISRDEYLLDVLQRTFPDCTIEEILKDCARLRRNLDKKE